MKKTQLTVASLQKEIEKNSEAFDQMTTQLAYFRDFEDILIAFENQTHKTLAEVIDLQREHEKKYKALDQIKADLSDYYKTTLVAINNNNNSITSLENFVEALNEELNLGSTALVIPDEKMLFAFAYTDSVVNHTPDHHFNDENIKGEITLTPPEKEAILVNPRVNCEGDSCPFVELSDPVITNDGRTVNVSYVVRGKPVKLKLSADVYLRKLFKESSASNNDNPADAKNPAAD